MYQVVQEGELATPVTMAAPVMNSVHRDERLKVFIHDAW